MSTRASSNVPNRDREWHPESVGNVELYYHALYHHVAHWAAYIAMMATLIGVGASLSGFQGTMAPYRILGASGVTFSAWVGAWYFMRGMDTYGSILCEAVPKAYLLRTQTFCHKTTIRIGKTAATVVGLADGALIIALVFFPK